MQCSEVQCSTVQYSALHCRALYCSAVHCSAVQFSAVKGSAMQCSAVQCSERKCSLGERVAVQCSVVYSYHYRPSTRTAQYSISSLLLPALRCNAMASYTGENLQNTTAHTLHFTDCTFYTLHFTKGHVKSWKFEIGHSLSFFTYHLFNNYLN